MILVLAITTAACGGSDTDNSSPRAGETISVESEQPSGEKTTTPAGTAKDLIVESQTVIHLPDQSGGNFYEVFVVVRNPRDEVAMGVSGQVSLKDEGGKLLKSFTPTEINILAGGRGLIQETADLPSKPMSISVESTLEAEGYRDGPTAAASPVTFTGVRLEPDDISGCDIVGTVSNTFSEKKDNLQVRVVGFNGDKIVTGGFTYVDTVFPKKDATFELTLFSPALCPKSVERLEVLANLGEDKIFNP